MVVVCAQMSSVSSLISSCASLFGFGASHTDESHAQPAGGAAAPPPAVLAAQAEAGTASAPPPLPPPGAVAAPFPQPLPPPPAAAAAAAAEADCGAGVGLLPVASSHGPNGQCVQPAAAAAAHMPVLLQELSEAQISSMATPELRDTAKALGFSGLGRAHELKRQILAEMQRRNIPMQQHQQQGTAPPASSAGGSSVNPPSSPGGVAAAVLRGFAHAEQAPVQHRSGPVSASSISSSAFGIPGLNQPPVGGRTGNSPQKTAPVGSMRTLPQALASAERNHGSLSMVHFPPGFPVGPYGSLEMHMDKIRAWSINPNVSTGIFTVRVKEKCQDQKVRVGPSARLVCNRQGAPPTPTLTKKKVHQKGSIRCNCPWFVNIEVVDVNGSQE